MNEVSNVKQNKTNKQMMILSAIGIFLVIVCHFVDKENVLNTIFPYTSFFMALFVFISGYFYSAKKEEHVGSYLWHKTKKILIPFFIINLAYGILGTILRGSEVIYYGSPINLYTLFVQPFINNNQFVFNFPSWFVPIFFVTNVVYILLHKVATKTKWLNDYVLLIAFLILGLVAVNYREFARLEDLRSLLLKVMFFLPFFQIGYLYKEKWQKYEDKIPTIVCFIGLIGINFILTKIFGDLSYDLHEFSGFMGTIWLPFVTAITGIWFYLRVAKILVKWLGENKFINYMSNNTFSIMSHHLLALFILDFILLQIYKHCSLPFFDLEGFKNGWFYIYRIPGFDWLLQIGYVIIGVTVPLGMKFVYDKIYMKIKKLSCRNACVK